MPIIQVTEVREGPFVDSGSAMVRSTIEEVFVIDTDKIPAFIADEEDAWRMTFVQEIIDDAIEGRAYVTRDIGKTFTDGASAAVLQQFAFRDVWYQDIYADEGAEPDIKIEVQIDPY
jgi:hypothetical protein